MRHVHTDEDRSSALDCSLDQLVTQLDASCSCAASAAAGWALTHAHTCMQLTKLRSTNSRPAATCSWVASWIDVNTDKPRARMFNASQHGFEAAKELASAARKAAEQRGEARLERRKNAPGSSAHQSSVRGEHLWPCPGPRAAAAARGHRCTGPMRRYAGLSAECCSASRLLCCSTAW
jgi:hypothetical protein